MHNLKAVVQEKRIFCYNISIPAAGVLPFNIYKEVINYLLIDTMIPQFIEIKEKLTSLLSIFPDLIFLTKTTIVSQIRLNLVVLS